MSHSLAPVVYSSPDKATSIPRIAYMMSRFPKISETFVLYEIVELERMGFHVEIFPLIRERENILHSEATPLVARAHYSTPTDRSVLDAQRYWLTRAPQRYLRTWATVIRENAASPKFLVRAVAATLQAGFMARRMHECAIQHMHAHFATHAALAAYVVHGLTNIPYSFTAHADDIYRDQSMLGEKIRRAAFVVTISDYNRRFLRERYGSMVDAKVRVNHCGVDTDLFAPRKELPARDTLIMTCVARLEEKKGHTYLIDACAQLRDRGVAFRCQIIGDGELQPEIKAQIDRLNLGEQVVLMGRMLRDRVQALLADSDVMVLPSVTTRDLRQEGIPVALMEAMATGLPVVSTRISGIPELIEHGKSGLLVSERNATALAHALLLLAGDPAVRAQLGREGRNKVLREFDLQENTAQLAAYFRQIVQR